MFQALHCHLLLHPLAVCNCLPLYSISSYSQNITFSDLSVLVCLELVNVYCRLNVFIHQASIVVQRK